jgi:hypothetical protein
VNRDPIKYKPVPKHLIGTHTNRQITNDQENNGNRNVDYPPPQEPQPRVIKSSKQNSKKKLKIYSHNVDGLKDESTIEYLTRMMDDKK